MLVVDGSGANQYPKLKDDSVLAGVANFTFTTATKIINIVDASVFTGGDAFKSMTIDVYDKQGNYKSAQILAAGGNVNIDLDAAVSLDMTGVFAIKVKVVSVNGFEKVGYYYDMPTNADIAATAIVFEK
jgi:hypothetical protein